MFIAFSVILSLAIIMEGYDTALLGSMIAVLLPDQFGYQKIRLGDMFMIIGAILLLFFVQNISILMASVRSPVRHQWVVFQTLTNTYAAEVAPVILRPYSARMPSDSVAPCAAVPSNPPLALGYISGCLLMLFIFTYNLAVGPVCYCPVAEIPSTLLGIKNVVLARNLYNIASIAANFLEPPILSLSAWNLRRNGLFGGADSAYCHLSGPTSDFLSKRI